MNLNDIYQIRVSYNYQFEAMTNVFYYRTSLSSGDGAPEVLTAFKASIWDSMRVLQLPSCVTSQYEVVNGMNNADAAFATVSDAGTSILTGSTAPNWALGLRSPRGQAGQRYSYKRLGGIPLGAWSSGAGWIASYVTQITNMTGALGQSLVVGTGAIVPVQITGGFRLVVPPLFKRFLAGTWSYNNWFTHQDTRQVYNWKL